MRFGIGQPVTRKEDARFLTGRGRYVADIDLVRQAHAVLVFSPHAHARIRAIDKAAAERMPGVYAVLIGEDWAADGLGTLYPEAMAEDMGGPPAFAQSTRRWRKATCAMSASALPSSLLRPRRKHATRRSSFPPTTKYCRRSCEPRTRSTPAHHWCMTAPPTTSPSQCGWAMPRRRTLPLPVHITRRGCRFATTV